MKFTKEQVQLYLRRTGFTLQPVIRTDSEAVSHTTISLASDRSVIVTVRSDYYEYDDMDGVLSIFVNVCGLKVANIGIDNDTELKYTAGDMLVDMRDALAEFTRSTVSIHCLETGQPVLKVDKPAISLSVSKPINVPDFTARPLGTAIQIMSELIVDYDNAMQKED